MDLQSLLKRPLSDLSDAELRFIARERPEMARVIACVLFVRKHGGVVRFRSTFGG